MPVTPVYSLPYELFPSDEPGITLHGGQAGNEAILAEAVEDELVRVDNNAVALENRVEDLEDQVFRLSRVALDGTVGTGTDIEIPNNYRGGFDSYVLEVDGHVSESYRPLLVLVNGIFEAEYRVSASAFSPVNFSVNAFQDVRSTAFPRFGFLGSFGSFHRIYLRPSTKGTTGFIQWISHGWVNQGGGSNSLVLSGGRWNGSVQEITHFTVRTTNNSDVWGSNSFATLWGRV